MRTVCALLNGSGGFVLFGVSDEGGVLGQAVTAGTLNEIANELAEIEPPALVPASGGFGALTGRHGIAQGD